MAAYLLFIREKVRNPEELRTYSAKAAEYLHGNPVEFLTRYGPHTTLEGDDPEGVLIISFGNAEEARSWYDAEGYQAASEYRRRGADYRVILVESS